MTSTDSTLSVESDLTSTPDVDSPPPVGFSDDPLMVALRVWRLALFESGAPSMYMAVPRALFGPVMERTVMLWAEDRFGLDISTPGSRAITSFRELVWRWSMAWREMFEAVLLPALFCVAVTTTCSSLKDTGFMERASSMVWPDLAVKTVSMLSIPKNSTESEISPAGTLSMLNSPSWSLIEYMFDGDRMMVA